MSKVDKLRVFVNERLTAAAEEIFGVLASTVAEYEEQLCRSKQENERQLKLLEAVLKPEVRLNRLDVQLDVEPPHLKEELEQLWSSQEGEQLEALVPGKSEDDEEKAQSSPLHQRQTQENKEEESLINSSAQQRETEQEDYGESKPACNLDPELLLQPVDDTEAVDSCEQADNSDADWKQNREPQPKLKILENSEVDQDCNTDIEFLSCSECGKTFDHEDWVKSCAKNPSQELACSVCVQGSTQSSRLRIQKTTFSGKDTFKCSICKKQFSSGSNIVRHIRTHTGEKPFGCSVCGQRFNQSTGLGTHMRIHTGEKPFSCSVCHKRFMLNGILARHMRVHTGEKPYTCSLCNTSFSLSQSLSKHMRIHTGEKPFSCPVCSKKFTQKGHLTQHMPLHTGERLFSCHVCGKKFSRRSRLKTHKCVT